MAARKICLRSPFFTGVVTPVLPIAGTSSATAQLEVVATVPLGHAPYGVAANPSTNRIYVANSFSDSMFVMGKLVGSARALLFTLDTPDSGQGSGSAWR